MCLLPWLHLALIKGCVTKIDKHGRSTDQNVAVKTYITLLSIW